MAVQAASINKLLFQGKIQLYIPHQQLKLTKTIVYLLNGYYVQ